MSTGSAITLTAQWTANTYTVSYAANGGSGSAPTSPTSCTYGSDCAAPANTYTRTGYTFAGWKCTGGTTACDGDIIAAGGSLKNVSTGSAITLTAQWNANCNAVTLNANGGTQGSVKTLYKKTGSGTWYANSNCTTAYTTTANIVPTRTGYTFRGFYVEDLDDVSSDNSSNTRYFSTDGTAADSSKSWLITGASTLYAAWARNCTVPVGGTCSLEIKTYGYVDYTTSCSAGYTLGNADTATPTCTAKTYTVSFNVNGGTGGQSANVTATYAAAMPAISTTAPTRAGYTFVGWYDNADYAAGVQYYTAAGASARNWNKTENATLYAGWTINGYDCKAGEYLNVTACKVCESGYYCPSTAVSYSYNGQIQGRTACSNKPENAVYTSATGNTSSSCPWTCNAGYYGTSANGNTSCAVCGTGNYCTGGLNKTACSATYANTTTTTTTATSSSACVCAAGYGGTSASSCTACAKGYYKASAGTVACTIADKNNYVAITGATTQTACTTLGSFYTTTDSTGSDAASDCYGTTTAGKYIATANSSTQTGCTNGNYCPATMVYYGKSGTNGGGLNVCAVPYSRSAAGSDDENDCYLITSATKYVKEVGAGEVDCPAGKYCAGGSTVYKGGTVSGRNTTGGSATCPAGSYCSEGVSEPTACSTLGGGLYKDSAEGSSAPADCYVITTGGYYVANSTDEAQTKCEAKYYCPAVILGYPSVGGRESCPDPASSTYKETVSEIDWLTARCPDATTSNSSVVSSGYQTFSNTGLSAITQCPAIMTVSTPCSNFSVESARYNSTTGRYDSDKGSVYARSVKAGYYLTERYSSTYCTTNGQPNTKSMLYKKAVKCPENSYCPGGTVPVCNTGTYEESWGANACTTLGDFYTTSAEGATTNTACYGITTAGKYIATAKADETTCAAGGYCPGSVKVNYNSTGGRTPCAAGKYNASTGSSAASACVACAIGSYAVDTGNTACTACAAGTTTTATGNTSATCSACANNNDYDNSWATPSWSANKVTNLCKISNCKAGSKYSSAAGTNTTGSCTACAAGTYQATNGSTATSCSAISAGCYGSAGATTECPNVCADNKYSDAGASSCTACPTDYKNSGTTVASHAGVASCKITVSDGYYIGTAGDNSSNWDKCAAGTAKAAHTVAYGSTSSCDVCEANQYSDAGAGACSACATDKGYSNSGDVAENHAGAASCKLSCEAGYYVPTAGAGCAVCPGGKYCEAVSDVAQTATTAVTGNVSAGYYSAGGGTTATGTCVSGYSCGSCSTGTGANGRLLYSGAGASACSECPAVTGELANRVSGYSGWWTNNIHGSIGGCYALFNDVDSTATFRTLCYYNKTDGTYGGANSSCQTYAPTACGGGYYSIIETADEWVSGRDYASCKGVDCMNGKVCGKTSAGYYSPDGAVVQTIADAGYYAPAGASAQTKVTAGCYADTEGSSTSCPNSCAALGGGLYKNSVAGSDARSDCYFTTTAGSYLRAASDLALTTCPSGDYCPAVTLYYDNVGGNKDCPGSYTAGGTGLKTQSECKISVADGKYVGTENSSTLSTCAAGTAKAAHTVAYGSTSSCDTCANWSYSAAGAASCTSCPALTSGWSKVDSTGTGWTTYTSCKQSQKPANCSSGGITQTATSSTQWGASSVTTALKANANYYVNGTACSACSGLASGFYPNSTAGNSGGASACYTNSLSGKYVASTNATSATNCAAGTYKGAHTVAYGSTSSCDTCGANQYSDPGAGACSACATDKGYSNSGTTATDHAGAASCKTTCMAGTMVATANAACSTPNNTAYGASWYTAEHIVAYGSTSKSLSKVSSCPTSYATVNNETATSHDAKSDCTITCAAGKVVANIDAACTTPSGSWYSAQHTVSAGGTSGTNKKSCLTNYATPSTTTQTDHDSSNDCAISCPAGTQIATANATTCTTPSGNWYVGANTVKQGGVSTVNTCAVGENLFNADDYGMYWGYFNSTNAVGLTAFENNAVVFVPVEGNTIYQISGMRGKGSMFVGTTTSEPATGVQVSGFVDAGAVDKGFVYRTPVDAKYLLVLALRSVDGSTTATRQAILDKNVANLQIFKANSGYGIVGNTATEHDVVSDCMIYCGAGEYVATAGGVCENVGAGYYGTGGIVPQGSISANRGQCVAPLTTIGYGFGANEADDCGRKLHAGSEVIYLRSSPRTSPALNVRVGDDIFYGAMSTALSGKLKVKDVDNTTYSVVNDYQ